MNACYFTLHWVLSLRRRKLTAPPGLRTSSRLEMGTAKPVEREFCFSGCARTDKKKGSVAIRSVTGTRIATENLRLVAAGATGVGLPVPPCATPYLYGHRQRRLD